MTPPQSFGPRSIDFGLLAQLRRSRFRLLRGLFLALFCLPEQFGNRRVCRDYVALHGKLYTPVS